MANPLDAFDWERITEPFRRIDWAYYNERIGGYHLTLDRLMFGLALLGAVVVVHLGIQQARGFEAGCVGLGALEPTGGAFDCAAVMASEASTLLGVSNVVWGALFYAAVAALSYVALAVPTWRLRAKQLRAGLIAVGVLYTGYLVYEQVGPLDALCVLCLVAAALVTALFALQAVPLGFSSRSFQSTLSARTVKREITLLTYVFALTGLVIAADVMYAGTSRTSLAAASSLPPAEDAAQVNDACSYDDEKSPVEDVERLVDAQDPTKGNDEAPVTVIEYFDPNCPHCKTMHDVMEEAVEAYGDEAQFVFKPMPLWDYSVPQIEALHVAAQEGKFFEMLDAQYERQQQDGLSPEELQEIARTIDVDPNALVAHLQQQTYRERVLEQREGAVEIGIDSTPTILVNGRFVDGPSRSLQCLGAFIEAAAQDAAAKTIH